MGIITDNTPQKKELINWNTCQQKIARLCTETHIHVEKTKKSVINIKDRINNL